MAREAVRIAGQRTTEDWEKHKVALKASGEPEAWKSAFEDFFVERLRTRYLRPITAIQEIGDKNGEGFAIVALQCSLIEFLEATRRGIKYVFRDADPQRFEYSGSRALFVNFLTFAPPFSGLFDKAAAIDFYEGVRCGLLHEARTKKGWRVKVGSGHEPFVDVTEKIVYRDLLQNAFTEYIKWYGKQLATDKELQSAFIRAFDGLCGD